MSIFNNDIISREYYVKDVYNIRVENEAWDALQENFYFIFGDKIYRKYMDMSHYIHSVIDNMQLVKFDSLLDSFIKEKDFYRYRQKSLRRFLRRKLKVSKKCLNGIYFDTGRWGSKYCIFIPNGCSIEYATADGITILIDKK